MRPLNPQSSLTALLGFAVAILGLVLWSGTAQAVGKMPYLISEAFPEIPQAYRGVGPTYEEFVDIQREELKQAGYQPWTWLQSDCQTCPLFILPTRIEIEDVNVYPFIRALETYKFELMELYHCDSNEYNLLARMAIGILGRESEFFNSPRYAVKESMPLVVHIIKVLEIFFEGSDREPDLNSRGPTQMKIVPDRIAQKYGIETDELYIPKNAALATMGYLIEALKEMKRRVVLNNWDYINPSNYADYLPYIYFGSKRQLFNRTATPDQNIYIRDMRKYMKWVEMYEGPASSQGKP